MSVELILRKVQSFLLIPIKKPKLDIYIARERERERERDHTGVAKVGLQVYGKRHAGSDYNAE